MSATEKTPRISLAQAMKNARLSRGFSISRLAKDAGIGKATICRWESRESQPSIYALDSISQALALTENERLELLSLIEAPRSTRAQREVDCANVCLEGAMPTVGDLLRALRVRAGLTPEQLGATVGVSTAAISKWERSERLPGSDNATRLATVLQASIEERALIGRASLAPAYPPSLASLKSEYQLILDDLGRRELSGMDLRFLIVEAKAWALSRIEARALEVLGEAFGCHSVYLAELGRGAESYRYANLAVSLPYHNARYDPYVTLAWRHFIKSTEKSTRLAISLVTDGYLQAVSVGAKLQTIGHRMRYFAELGLEAQMERDAEAARAIAEESGPERIAYFRWTYADALCAARRPEEALKVLPLGVGQYFMLPIHLVCTQAEALLSLGERDAAEPYLNELRAHEAKYGRLNFDEKRVLAMA